MVAHIIGASLLGLIGLFAVTWKTFVEHDMKIAEAVQLALYGEHLSAYTATIVIAIALLFGSVYRRKFQHVASSTAEKQKGPLSGE